MTIIDEVDISDLEPDRRAFVVDVVRAFADGTLESADVMERLRRSAGDDGMDSFVDEVRTELIRRQQRRIEHLELALRMAGALVEAALERIIPADDPGMFPDDDD